ncbi:RNA polymerase sigma factor SigW [Heyndrickxia coagulans P38]|uniref:RNA polymerase sigma factor SigW n=1 Tax=Heyndrickxia coagulans TaxID=1398 RepID=UPI00054E883A|nr:RNA polymerase sigma factor SigW [Heyndrickxia coagulans]KGT37886.1 RNA polymerase sigma factor SigW [Heyndrickxia coagulans P38]
MEAIVDRKIKQVMKGDQNAFNDIVELYKDKVFQICFRMIGSRTEAEDLAQETFIRAYIHIKSFKQERKFSSWLYRIATNLCIDRIRKKKPDFYLDAEISGTEGLTLYSTVPAEEKLPDMQVETLEMQEMIRREILKLPEKYRIIIVLKYIEELSLNEISEMLDIPLGTVKTRIHRGREALRKQLGRL